MTGVAFIIFALIALAAASFAAGPVLARKRMPGRLVLAAAAVLFVMGVGGGLYLYLGQPALAVRTLQGENDRSLNAVIGRLAKAVRTHPADARGWALLGQAYMTAHDPVDAASAFARAIAAAGARGRRFSFLYSAYGEALADAASGAVTPDAESAFDQAIALDPKDVAARYFLGLSATAHGNTAQALAYWNDLLVETPQNSQLHADLVDRIAALTARGGNGAPNIAAMVAGLAARLKTDPDDPAGWQRLIRAYAVMGEKDKARAALSDARKAAARHGDILAALAAEQKELGL
jgi:cytochrome c-type biogenesis protein CcmH